ncbi:MAG TPA: isopentenyl-diphosphate Delta-isomerase [Gammaproteobacteria bacterium]|jgi:isopentenyl-diphosphate delta-isomerase
MGRRAVVSDSAEELILVDEQDREIGAKSKGECHAGLGILHRAFSIFVFNSRNELLLQKRSSEKPLWPNYWSNTCCSHPRVGETMDQAVKRRLAQELGIDCPLTYLYKFKYNAKYGSLGSEREFCWVYYGHHEGDLDVNLNEVADWRFVDVESLDAELAASADRFTPWLRLEWAELKEAYLDDILVAID